MTGIILFLLASIIKWACAPFLYLFGLMSASSFKELGRWHFDLAVSKDQHGNVLGQYFFNHFLITLDGYKFGLPDETISSVIGKNKRKGTLTGAGRFMDGLLDFFDKNHSINAIEDDEG